MVLKTKQKKIKIHNLLNIGMIVLILLIFPALAMAQTGENPGGISAPPVPPAAGEPEPFKAPAAQKQEDQSKPGATQEKAIEAEQEIPRTTIIIYVKNRKTGRFLGDVEISIDSANQKVKTSDPPSPSGYQIPNVPTGERKIIAQRRGYKIYEKKISLSKELTYQEINIEMEPLPGLPEFSDTLPATQYNQNNFNGYLSSQWPSSQYNSSTGNPWNSQIPSSQWNNPSSTINPYNTNYPGYSYYPNLSSNNGSQSQSPYQWPNSTGSYGLPSYNGYNLTSDTGYTIPVKVDFLASASTNLEGQILSLKIIDANQNNSSAINNEISLGQVISQNGHYLRFGCLLPNHQYVIKVSNQFQQNSASEPIVGYFITPSTGATEITVPLSGYQGGISGQINVQQTPIENASIRCPLNTNNYGNYNQAGAAIFNDQTMDFQGLNNYQMVLNPQDGSYYLVNRNNPTEMRQIVFIDSGSGQNGIAFIPAEPGIYGSQNSSLTWYVTGYSRDTSGNISLLPNQFQRVDFSPYDYANLMNGQVRNDFYYQNVSPTLSSAAGQNSITGKCINYQNQTFCFYDQETYNSYSKGELNNFIQKIVEKIKQNIDLSKDKKGSPDLNILMSDKNFTSLINPLGAARTCWISNNTEGNDSGETSNSPNSCYNILKSTIGSSLTDSTLSARGTIVYSIFNMLKLTSNESTLNDNLNHEWAHIYDYKSDFKENANSISRNENYYFINFFNKTQEEAQAQITEELPKSLSSLPIPSYKKFPLCVYSALEALPNFRNNSGKYPVQFSGNSLKPSEIFAYSFQIARSNMTTKILNIFDEVSADQQCKEETQKILEEYPKLFTSTNNSQ